MNDAATHNRINHLLRVAGTAPSAQIAQGAFREAQALINECNGVGVPRLTGGGSREPFDVGHSVIQIDQVHPPNSADMIIPLMAPSRYLVLPNPPAVGAGLTSQGTQLLFTAGGGWLIGWRGCSVDNTPGVEAAGDYEQCTLGVRMFINDGEELITNGRGADFVPFGEVFPESAQWAPIMRRVDVTDTLTCIFRNFQPVATGNTLQPRITFAFWREKYPGTT